MRPLLLALLLAAACSQPRPRDPSVPPIETPDGPAARAPEADRDEIVAFLDDRPIYLTDVGRYLIDQDYFQTVQRYVAYLVLEALRRDSGLTNEASELDERARWEVRRGRTQYGTEWVAFLRAQGADTEDDLVRRLAGSARMNEMLLNEKLFYRDVYHAGFVACRVRYFAPGGTEPAETIERLMISDATPAPFLTLEAQARLLLSEPGETVELDPATGEGRYVVEVLEREAARDLAPAELTRMVMERPPETHELGLWVAHQLQTAQEGGRIRYANRDSERD